MDEINEWEMLRLLALAELNSANDEALIDCIPSEEGLKDTNGKYKLEEIIEALEPRDAVNPMTNLYNSMKSLMLFKEASFLLAKANILAGRLHEMGLESMENDQKLAEVIDRCIAVLSQSSIRKAGRLRNWIILARMRTLYTEVETFLRPIEDLN